MRYYTSFEDFKEYPKDKVKFMLETLMDTLHDFNLLSFDGFRAHKKGIDNKFILEESFLNDNGKTFLMYNLPQILKNPNAFMESDKLSFIFRNMYLSHSISLDQDTNGGL